MRTPENWVTQLRDAGLKATAGRVEALMFLQNHPHATAAEMYDGLRHKLAHTSLQAVHNIVTDLHISGLIRRVDLPDSPGAQYETRTGDNHHHMQCIICGRVQDVDCAVGVAPCLTPSEDHGMKLLEAAVIYRGICPECQAKQTVATADTDTDITAAPRETATQTQ